VQSLPRHGEGSEAKLAGKVAVVTGAGRGLGRAVVQGFAREGAHVIGIARSAGELASLATETNSDRLQTDVVDLADDEAVWSWSKRVLARHGRVDVLVNNAAILELASFHEMTMDDFDRTMTINLRGAVLCTRAFIGAMREADRGSIINVGSAASYKGFPQETHYCAAKFALEGFSEALAIEARAYNVAVNRLTPGYLIKPTSITLEQAAAAPSEVRGQWQDPAAMVDAFTYLALQCGSGVTGYRFDAFALAERVRAGGWERLYTPEEIAVAV
jgi:NAD(P)-dependent dehydrogenase (short-subunit alcohol dehydrogenase family)